MNIINKIQKNVSLAKYSTFKIGGPAEFFLRAQNKDEFIAGVKWANDNKRKIIILGGGSNVLINDDGVKGLVIKIEAQKADFDGKLIKCEAGASLSSIANLTYKNSLSGFEWSVGIPGTIGGAVLGNAGAFGESMEKSVKKVIAYDISAKKLLEFLNKDCKFKYRDSFFKRNSNICILQVELKLSKSNQHVIKQKMDEYILWRRQKQPVLPSAGSVFKNIQLDDLSDKKLIELAKKENVVKGNKIPAGWLIGLADLKNISIGGAKVSDQHANFIINTGQATAEDVVMLISLIKTKIRNKYQILLQDEIICIGF
jgi:UDP-N-acetylmuramate dehydrogenase